MMRFLLSLLLLSAMSFDFVPRPAHAQMRATAIVDEVHIEQEKGRITKKKAPSAESQSKSAPEGAAPAQSNSNIPTTCDAKNASSQACYTATQQGHR